jgi:hypothetical protein
MLARTEPPEIEEQQYAPQPRTSDLVNKRMRVIRDGREFIQVTTTAKPGRAIFCIVRLIAPDGRETYQIGTRRTRGRPPKQNGKSHG